MFDPEGRGCVPSLAAILVTGAAGIAPLATAVVLMTGPAEAAPAEIVPVAAVCDLDSSGEGGCGPPVLIDPPEPVTPGEFAELRRQADLADMAAVGRAVGELVDGAP